MNSHELDAPLPVWVEPHPPTSDWTLSTPARFFFQVLALVDVEFRKLWRDPSDLITRAVQPALWLLIFGNVFSKLRAVPTGDMNYLDYW